MSNLPRAVRFPGIALGLLLTLLFSLAPSHTTAAFQGVWAAGLGDNEICGDGIYLGRIVTSGGYTVGQQITVGDFTIEVTSVKDGGQITGFIVVAGPYDYLVIHAGDGSATFSDPTGPFANGLSFVAFCANVTIPTPTNTTEPTSTNTPVPPTETPTDTPTETPGITPTLGGVTEVPSETPEDTPTVDTTTSTPVVDPTEAPDDDLVDPGGLPDTGSGPDNNGTVWLAGLMALVATFAGLSWFFRRVAAWD